MKSLWLLVVWMCLAPAAQAAGVDYLTQIKPVLHERCYSCHGALKQEANLRLDTAAFAIRGGDSGAAVTPGDPEASEIVRRVAAENEYERMPPEGEPLKPEEIAALKAWIAQGAKHSVDEPPERDPRDHWAFKTPVRPPVPVVGDAAGIGNPIDAFIAARRREHDLRPQPAAEKRVWLRRVSLDLVGLPPTRDELDAFLADDSPDAYDRVVTRLLDSPQYGQRWGRHWMDIWRYSDPWGLGAEVRNSQKHIWHWRDWIIESLNADKGYDQMLREMLAADELYPNDLDRLRATGFLARQYFKFNRTTWLDGVVEHTSKAMLGLTYNCAKCHDHKFDPITHLDYYRLRAVFEPYQIRTDAVPGEIDFEKDGIPRAFDCNLDATTYLHLRGDERNPDKTQVIEPAVPSFLSAGALAIEPVELPVEAYRPELRPFVVETHLQHAAQQIAAAQAALDAARAKLAEAEQGAATQPAAPAPLVRDDFSVARPDLWEMTAGRWMYADGKLVQSQAGAARATLRLKQAPPADFEARLKYVPTGGDKWKSVGLCFDVAGQQHVLAYLSSYAAGSKSQISYQRDGKTIYPPGAAQRRPVELGQPHELTLRVRGTLLNVAVDGQHSIAYRLPHPRHGGRLELITFDATAEFLSFELSELPKDVTLVEAAPSGGRPGDGPVPLDQARLAVVVAEKALVAAAAQPDSIKARAAADRARFQQPPAENAMSLIVAAVRAERTAAAAKADEEVARAELEVRRATAAKKAAAEKKRADAKKAAEAARAAIDTPGETYTPLPGALKTLESNVESEESRRKPFPQVSSGRRRALANWMTDPRHPLTARVAVNHIWSRHFGRPLVPTVFDFGRRGTPPTHPQLLDWLAVELIENGWSMKQIHRLIVTSHTYRLSSSSAGASAETLARDAGNRFYWRANPIRMEAQLVRDSLLSLAGELDVALGGPPVPAGDDASRRRSLYFVHSHNEKNKFLSMFDDAGVLECYRRAESIVPQQALTLENSELAITMAEKIAARLAAANPAASDAEFIRDAFVTVLSVEPTADEQAVVAEALAEFTAAANRADRPNAAARARTHVIQALVNHNDFVTIR